MSNVHRRRSRTYPAVGCTALPVLKAYNPRADEAAVRAKNAFRIAAVARDELRPVQAPVQRTEPLVPANAWIARYIPRPVLSALS